MVTRKELNDLMKKGSKMLKKIQNQKGAAKMERASSMPRLPARTDESFNYIDSKFTKNNMGKYNKEFVDTNFRTITKAMSKAEAFSRLVNEI